MTKTERKNVEKAMERIATYLNRYSCIALDLVDEPFSGLAERYSNFYEKGQNTNWFLEFKIFESDKAAEARLTALALFMVAEQDVIK